MNPEIEVGHAIARRIDLYHYITATGILIPYLERRVRRRSERAGADERERLIPLAEL